MSLFGRSLVITALLALLFSSTEARGDNIKFLSIGDWGDDTALVGSGLSKFFAEEADGVPVALLLGDNFYDFGVKSVDDHQWKKKYLDVFSGKELEKIRFMVTSGNHDYYGNVTAQIQYSKKDPTKRWMFPSYYHSRLFEQNGIKLFIVAIDTWRLNGGDTIVGFDPKTGRKWLRSKEALRRSVVKGEISAPLASNMESNLEYDPETKPGVDEEQYEWLNRTLATKSSLEADWRIVMGHFPIHSASLFEHGDTKNLVDRLDGVLRKHNVDAYFAGHDHILQINKRGGLHYYGCGAGAKRHPTLNKYYWGLQGYTVGAFGFMKHKATKHHLETTFVVSDGDGLGDTKSYSFTYSQDKVVPPEVGGDGAPLLKVA